MQEGWKLKCGLVVWIIEARAARYRDPIQRLRYLRRRQDWRSTGEERPRFGFRWVQLAPLLLLLLLVPIPTVSDMSLYPDPEVLAIEQNPADLLKHNVWLVEQTADYEQYSNGLRIETKHEVRGEKRPYPVYDSVTLDLLEWQSGPIGIVYHTTESNAAPFEPGHNKRLRRIGQWLLEHVHRHQAYHYVIDRFGRVHRIVRETDTANHSGYSVWADERKLYVNLNPSFLGISFEAETVNAAEGPGISEAQIHAARVLTEMLRGKFGIKAKNCVTHAQVSVAPWNMRMGNHVDWAANFPFGELGLVNSYGVPSPAVAVFGFGYDGDFLKSTGPELWKGVALGADAFRRQARSEGLPPDKHRAARKKRYREIIQALEDVIDAVEKTT